MNRKRTALMGLVAATAVAAAAITGTAAAATVSADNPCGYSTFFSPFKGFGDVNTYVPVPGGSFEPGQAAWTLGGSSVGTGNETYYVNSTKDTRSLTLPAGSSATSPAMCIAVDYRTIRFFALNSGNSSSTLRVDLVYVKSGVPQVQFVGRITSANKWQPSPILTYNTGAFGCVGSINVAFRFTVEGSGSWKIDDAYVDPRLHK